VDNYTKVECEKYGITKFEVYCLEP
jgi:hypothetical protein